MNQLLWLANILPDFVWPALALAGILALAISYLPIPLFVPFVAQYKAPLRIVGVIALLIGVYFQGVVASENRWKQRVADLEEKVKVAEDKAKKANEDLSVTIEEKNRIIQEKGKEIIKYIDRWRTKEIPIQGPERVRIEEVIKIIERCPVPKELVNIHNMAAENPLKGQKK